MRNLGLVEGQDTFRSHLITHEVALFEVLGANYCVKVFDNTQIMLCVKAACRLTGAQTNMVVNTAAVCAQTRLKRYLMRMSSVPGWVDTDVLSQDVKLCTFVIVDGHQSRLFQSKTHPLWPLDAAAPEAVSDPIPSDQKSVFHQRHLLYFLECLLYLISAKERNIKDPSFLPLTFRGEAALKELSEMTLFNPKIRKLWAQQQNCFLPEVSELISDWGSVVTKDHPPKQSRNRLGGVRTMRVASILQC